MKTLLHLISSIFGDGGQSSRLSAEFVAFLGITEVKFVFAEGLAISEASKTQSLAAARNALRALVQPETIAA